VESRAGGEKTTPCLISCPTLRIHLIASSFSSSYMVGLTRLKKVLASNLSFVGGGFV